MSGRPLRWLISTVSQLFYTIVTALGKNHAAEIKQKTVILTEHPLIGRAIERRPEYRELVLEVSNAKYVFRYAFDGKRLVMLRVFRSAPVGP